MKDQLDRGILSHYAPYQYSTCYDMHHKTNPVYRLQQDSSYTKIKIKKTTTSLKNKAWNTPHIKTYYSYEPRLIRLQAQHNGPDAASETSFLYLEAGRIAK